MSEWGESRHLRRCRKLTALGLQSSAMGQLIQFEEHAVARLRERLGAAEEANQDLIAFARGHSGAVTSIHAAVLAAMEADSVET